MRPRAAGLAFALVAPLALAACIGGDDDAAPGTAAERPAGTVVPPPSASPFCEGMLAIADRLAGDDRPTDVAAFLVEAYREILADAPAELTPDLEALIESLEQDSELDVATATTSVTAPPDNVVPTVIVLLPAERVANYVTEHCGRVEANPGPPPTEPSGGIATIAPD